jgi:hypothetical protein
MLYGTGENPAPPNSQKFFGSFFSKKNSLAWLGSRA